MKSIFVQKVHNDVDQPVDLTPMLDVVFILLIFFVVTATFIKERGLDILSSNEDNSSHICNTTVLVNLDQSGTIWLDREAIHPLALTARLQALKAEDPTSSAVILAHPEAKISDFTNVLDSTRKIFNYDEISLQKKV